MSPLEELIRAEIAGAGSMRFDRFMELALYHPELGYYAKPGRAIGRTGDFYTSVSVGPLFGRLLARQFFQMWQRLERVDNFWIVEQGAHDGQLARDVLEWCRDEVPEFARALRYGIVAGPAVEGTIGFANLEALAAQKPEGVFFSNELVDAFPVRVIVHRAGEWRERCVEIHGDALDWTEQSIADAELIAAMETLALPEIEGYVTEINLAARKWIIDVARALHRGYVVTIDYGFPSAHYYAPHRITGTLAAYEKHQRFDDVLAEPGARDLTAHVDFTALARAGSSAGLETLGLVDQQRLLTGIAQDEIGEVPGPRVGIAKNTRAFQTLTHPGHLGGKFFALVQAKDAPGDLHGLRFAREVGLL